VPLSKSIDNFPADKFNIYGFKRPVGTDKSLIDSLYIDYTLWEGHYNIPIYGLIGTRSEKSTVSHYKYQCLWFVNNEYNKKNYEKTYEHLQTMFQDLSAYDSETANFTVWYRMIAIGYQINKIEGGLNGIKELIKRKNNIDTINGIRKNAVHLLECVSHYNVPELFDEIYSIINRNCVATKN
jgi:hypothetical protein